MTTATVGRDVHDEHRTARLTGLAYLGLALTGLFGFLIVRPMLFDPGDAAATAANLAGHEALARAGIALELGVVLTQALTAVWFYRLFRTVDAFAAGAIAAFGLMNAASTLVSAAVLATALDTAQQSRPAGALPQLLYLLSENLWGVGAVFFGLWLIPMGVCVLRSGRMPRWLGRILVAGGVGYVLAAFTRYLMPDAGPVPDLLGLPASVGEFWMLGFLLLRGAGRAHPGAARPA